VATDWLGISISVVGGALIPIALYAGQKSVARAQATMDLLKEFNSSEMAEARGKARRFVLDSPGRSYAEMEELPVQEGQRPEAEYLYLIVRFYHRLNALRESNLLQDNRLLTLFGPVFGYWWKLSFEPQLMNSSNWRVGADIRRLKNFFDKRSIAENKNAYWQQCLQDGLDDRLSEIDRHSASAQAVCG